MDQILAVVDGRFRVSIVDSTMMWIVHFAMDKAHEKVKSKEGVIGRLNEISKFYELAVMQLEGCLKFVQEEADSDIIENSHAKVLIDLREIRNRLQGRLEETELAICKKDGEMKERVDNELKLRQALEIKERELDSLRANLELERTKSEGIEELILTNQVRRDEGRDGEICELKHSVDQQVWSIKQKLEPDNEDIVEERYRGIDNKRIEEMGADIHILKETLDLAFGKMQNAIFSSEVGPIEHQWRWTIEKDTIAILIKGFIKDFRKNFELELSKREEKFPVAFRMHLSDLMKGVTNLRWELGSLITQGEVPPVKSIKSRETSAPSSHANLECPIPRRAKSEALPDSGTHRRSSDSLKNEAAENMKRLPEENQNEDASNFVAKLIKNHESIIRKKKEELNWLKSEILREKASSRRDKDPDSLKRRIEEVIIRLDNLIDLNSVLRDKFGEYRGFHAEETYQLSICLKSDVNNREKLADDTFEGVWEKINKGPVSNTVKEEQQNEIGMLKEEKREIKLLTMIMEEVYVTLFEGLANDFYIDLYSYELESLVRESMWNDLVNDWKENIEDDKIVTQIGEEIYCIVFSIAVNSCIHDFTSAVCQASVAECNLLDDSTSSRLIDYLKGMPKENGFSVIFQEIIKEWEKSIQHCNAESLLREKIDRVLFHETIVYIINAADYKLSHNKNVNLLTTELIECVENSVEADVQMVFLREMVREWEVEIEAYCFEILVREEIHQFVVLEGAKDACIHFQNNTSDNSLSDSKSLGDNREENLIQNLDSLLKYLDLVYMELKDLDECKLFKESSEEENILSSVRIKLEKASQQLSISKALLCESGSNSGIQVDSSEMVLDPMTPTVDIVHDREISFCPPKVEVQCNPSDSAFTPILRISQVLENFECTMEKRLGMNIGRLEEVKCDIAPLVEHVATVRKKATLYRRAFISRSQSLQKAEIEVDLLGDQVDVLLGLLEKIYTKLHHYSPVLEQNFDVGNVLYTGIISPRTSFLSGSFTGLRNLDTDQERINQGSCSNIQRMIQGFSN